ncbi:MAG: VWA domain-containing protein [Thermoleophilia bacterium]|nr:VWA domain-containing protein [Thermoleophilia bacterium]
MWHTADDRTAPRLTISAGNRPILADRLRPRIAWPTLAGFPARGPRSWGGRLRLVVPGLLRGAALACLVVGLARPQTVAGRTRLAGRGVAIVVALDQSSSMNTADFPDGPDAPPSTRLDAARRTFARFVTGRADDLIGLVVFANYPDLAAPPTLDHDFLRSAAAAVRPARPGDDGTNLGDAVVWSLDALRDASPAKKVLILLTDGRNSPAVARPADPVAAAEIARGLGVTVHTIAVGRAGASVLGVDPATGREVRTEVEGPDLDLLRRIAETGGGRAFQATDAGVLDAVFREIDALEKSPVRGEVRTRYREEYAPWAFAALGLIALDRWLAGGRSRLTP